MVPSPEQPGPRLPLLPIRDAVVFPGVMTPFVVGRKASVRALQEALAAGKKIFLATQRNGSVDEPRPDEIYTVGTVAAVVQSMILPNGNIKVLVEGLERGEIVSISEHQGCRFAVVKTFDFPVEKSQQLEELAARVASLLAQSTKVAEDSSHPPIWADDMPGKLADLAASTLQVDLVEKQKLLEVLDPTDRLARVADLLEIEIARLSAEVAAEGTYKPGSQAFAAHEWGSYSDDPVEVYLREVQTIPPLSLEQETECVRHIRAKDEKAEWSEKTLVEVNLHLVVTIARQHRSDRVHILDLIHEGNQALLEAVKSFSDCDADDFTAYATPYIERAIAQAIK